MKKRQTLALVLGLCAFAVARAGDLAFSDPAHVTPPPAWAVGQAQRTPDFDALPGFQKPPPGFGVVPFFWWLGDPLTQERLTWVLEQMAGTGIAGYQINYAHSDQGGRSYGATYASDPTLFSEDWWKLVGRFMQAAKQQGAGISLSDYTLGPGQGWCFDAVLHEHPEVTGMNLRMGPDGKVSIATVPGSLNPLHPLSGKLYAEKFFGEFERRNPGEGGKGLNFFFSDELTFGVGGHLWSLHFAEEFKKRKGYDIWPELPALFKDIGPRTPKIRLDYSDVMVSLTEEGYFKPIFDWHQQRGMTMGCDHGGRGRNVVEFGDYFRTQRWMQGPGADQPNLGKNLIKAKVASSMAHLYLRPRVWLEGFYGSGWGTTSAGLVDATFADFVMGYNLLAFHGMYYSTHGGWWEWAPPDNTFRMPYWKHMRGFMDCVQRLAYVLSQGHHRCDVAILYPVAAVEAGMDGAAAVETAFATGTQLYAQAIDFDFMDFESLDRAQIVGQELRVSGESYRVLVLPAMKAVRHSTLQKALAFRRSGGTVIALGALPEASDRIGRADPEVAAMVKELFPSGVAADVFAQLPAGRDYEGPGCIQHRKLGPRDLYAIYGAPQNTECFFRATGKVELWDPWTGRSRPLAVTAQTAAGTRLKLPLTGKELQLIVFSPGQPELARAAPEKPASIVSLTGDWDFELQPTSDNRFGDFHWPPTATLVGAEARRLKYADETAPEPGWQAPAFDDSHWRKVTCGFGPRFWKLGPLPGDAAADEQLAALKEINPAQPVVIGGKKYPWQPYEFSWRFGIEDDTAHQGYHGLKEQVADEFIGLGAIRPGMPSSKREPEKAGTRYYLWTTAVAAQPGPRAILQGGLLPSQAWLNGAPLGAQARTAVLRAGANPLLLRYDKAGRGYFLFSSATAADAPDPQKNVPWNAALAMRWYNDTRLLTLDTRPQTAQPAGWYRFTAPPGLRGMTLPTRAPVQAWADGKECKVTKAEGRGPSGGQTETCNIAVPAATGCVQVALRVEQERGNYGGAAFSDYIQLDCGPGRIALGDWSQNDGLAAYSGGAWYRKTVMLTAGQLKGATVQLSLGEVAASAEVLVNGRSAGIKVSPPWNVDITKLVQSGENTIEVLVCNTLANHYLTIPTRYRGAPTSGLLGPVQIELTTP